MSDIQISVIVLSYNEKEYIRTCLNSILLQDFTLPYEIIVVDDCSNDGSIEIIESYEKIIKNYKNIAFNFHVNKRDKSEYNLDNIIPSVRVSNSLRYAFNHVRGKYLCVISGDDYYTDTTFLTSMYYYLENNPTYLSAHTGYILDRGDGNNMPIAPIYDYGNGLFYATYYKHISTFFFNKKCLNNLIDDIFDDTGLSFSIYTSGPAKYINTISFAYRQRDNSIWNTSNKLEQIAINVILFELCCKTGKLANESLSLYYITLDKCFNNKDHLCEKKYKKYITYSKEHNLHLLQDMIAAYKGDKSKNEYLKDFINNAKSQYEFFLNQRTNKEQQVLKTKIKAERETNKIILGKKIYYKNLFIRYKQELRQNTSLGKLYGRIKNNSKIFKN